MTITHYVAVDADGNEYDHGEDYREAREQADRAGRAVIAYEYKYADSYPVTQRDADLVNEWAKADA